MTRDEVRELIVKAIDDSTQLIDFGDFTVSETDFDAASEAVLAAFAARGILLGERAGLTEDEDRTLARCIADADKNTLADPSFSALDDLLLIGLPSVGLALVRVVE